MDEPVRESVAPPGWSTPPELAPPPRPASSPAPATAVLAHHDAEAAGAAGAADAAVRWRMRAARIDNLIVYGGYLLVCLVLHRAIASVVDLIWLAVAGAAYHFAFEARDGQTIGKRRYGIRVVAADGGPAAARAVAIRSLVRIVDALPVCYLVGLLSMVLTGPVRRQRVGDLAAGTIVVAVDGRAAQQGTPRWLLPLATLVAVVVSAMSVVALAGPERQTLTNQSLSPLTASAHGP